MQDLREEYKKHSLGDHEVADDPIAQFDLWFNEALEKGQPEPNAMVLSTVSGAGVDARTVLLKGVEAGQFIFFTNYNSHKGQQLIQNPHCNLLFLWLQMERQVKITGLATKTSAKYSDDYFASRPRGSQLGAWASEQSQIISGRKELEAKLAKLEEEYEGREVPRPAHWGGFSIQPVSIEFWQGRPNRLHDRLIYMQENGKWKVNRLQP